MLLDRASQRAQENGARLAKDRAGLTALSERSMPSAMPANGPRASSGEATLAKLRELHPPAAELDDDDAERWDAVLAA